MTRLSPDEYADLLVARRDAYYVEAATRRARTYRPASYWRDRLAKVDARLDAIDGIRRHDTSDLAAYGGIGIRQTPRQTRRHGARIDAAAAEYVRLTTQRSNLAAKHARAETREKATT